MSYNRIVISSGPHGRDKYVALIGTSHQRGRR